MKYQGLTLPSAGADLLVGLDIDGTVLHHKKLTISPRVREAIKAHIVAGSHMIIATGRGVFGAFEALEEMQIGPCLAVCSNGAICVAAEGAPVPDALWASPELKAAPPRTSHGQSYRVFDLHTFDPSRELAALHAALPNALVAVEELDEPRRVSAPFPPGEITGPTIVVPFEELASDKATRLTLRAPELDDQDFDNFLPSLGLEGVDYTVGWSAWFDVTPPGVSKASALAHLAEVFGAAHTVCVGDGGNDVEMIQWAEIGAVMGQARESVKAAGDLVLPSVDEDGLAELLEAML